MKFPTMDEFAKGVAEKALDEIEYNGKTIRQWIEIIASNDGDTISRKAAIEAVRKLCDECDNGGWCGECRIDHPDKDAIDVLEGLPPIQPNKDKVSNLLYHIYSNQSPHLDMSGVIAKKYYCEELWKELFGKGSELPGWMS